NHKELDLDSVFDNAAAVVDTDGKTVTVTVDPTVASGNYEVTSEKGFVQDDAATPNDSQEVTKDLYIGEAEELVEADVKEDKNVFTITFDKAVTSESAMNPANYTVDGKALPADTKIVVEDDQTVEFQLPAVFIAEDKDDAKVTVDNIVPVDSNAKFSPYAEASHSVYDNTAPEASGKLLKDGQIQLTFSEDVASVEVADFDEVIVNDLVLLNEAAYSVEAVETNDGEDAVKITVNADVETHSGVTYLYIDVDGEGFNHDNDIILDQINGDEGKDDWYVDGEDDEGNPTQELKPADLNKVDSVVVNVKEDAATTDTSELKNSLKAGNVTIK